MRRVWRRGGQKTSSGKGLEKLLRGLLISGVHLERIHDSAAFGTYSGHAVPCDFIGSLFGYPGMVECKETVEERLPFSKLLREQSRHQWEAMTRFRASHRKNIAGYLCRVRGGFVWAFVEQIHGEGSVSLTDKFLHSHDIVDLFSKIKETHESTIV